MNSVKYTGLNTNRGPSDSIWGSCPVNDLVANPFNGFLFHDDFVQSPILVTPTITTQANYGGGYKAFGVSGSTILNVNTVNDGQLQFVSSAGDNDGVSLASIALPVKIIRGGGNVWFEARLKHLLVTDTQSGVFCGLVEQQTLTTTVPLAAAGTMADANFCGFIRRETNGDNVEAIYKANGVTEVAVSATAGVPVTDTFYKVGFFYDDSNYGLKFFYNGVQVGSTKTILSAAGTDFPNDVQMGLCLASINATAAAQTNTIDWWRLAHTNG